jgi:periplasmic protein CpxP/Spy
MFPLFRSIPRLAPVVRSLAVASLLGTTFLAGSLGPVAAQAPAQKPPAAAAATSDKPESVEQRIATLKTALKITADQEAKWGVVATAMRDNAAAMDKLVQTKRAIAPASMTAMDDLNTYEEFTKVRLDGLKNLTSAFKSLYNSMPADQQKNVDQVFMAYGSAPAKG